MKVLAALALAIAIVSVPAAALAEERLTDGVLGALAGAVVGGPVGAVVGGGIGYAAGPHISRGIDRTTRHPRRQPRPARRRGRG